jgi:hypothetical protein
VSFDGPWVYPYVEDPHSSGVYHRDNIVLRPVLEIELLGPALLPDDDPPRVAALVDSGAERSFAAPWLARAIGADLHDAPEIRVGLGGSVRRVQFAQVTLRLHEPAGTTSIEWQADVGFIDSWEPPWGLLLGQRGFFDQFTVSLNRYAQAFAIEPVERFDDRFGPP